MKRKHIVAAVLASLVLTSTACLALLSFGFFGSERLLPPVPSGHREIIFLAPATSSEAWERLIAAVAVLQQQPISAVHGKVGLNVAKERAFTDLTADVPEVVLWPDGCEDAKLWIRWCKLSAEANSEQWISRLAHRPTPPLVIIGGETSFRARTLAEALQRHRDRWSGPAPLFFITTATADRFVPHNLPNVTTTDQKWPKLIDIYSGRSFRFSFTNSRMAAAVLDFVRTHDELWPNTAAPRDLAAPSAAACASAGQPLMSAVLAASASDMFTNYLYTLKWDDDSFSADLADRFRLLFLEAFPRGRVSPNQIEYSVGDFYQPNPREAFVVGQLLPELKAARDHRQLMLLPADSERARRFLRAVVRRSTPADLKNLVVLTGDSLSFNTIFRDRNVAWNIQDLPVPLVVFSHRSPVAEDAGFKETTAAAATGTEDLLLYRDILETALLTAYRGQELKPSSDDLMSALHSLSWAQGHVQVPPLPDAIPLFNAHDGNRHDGTGEHIIVLRPDPDDHGLLAQATIKVYRNDSAPNQRPVWRVVRTLTVTYDNLPGG